MSNRVGYFCFPVVVGFFLCLLCFRGCCSFLFLFCEMVKIKKNLKWWRCSCLIHHERQQGAYAQFIIASHLLCPPSRSVFFFYSVRDLCLRLAMTICIYIDKWWSNCSTRLVILVIVLTMVWTHVTCANWAEIIINPFFDHYFHLPHINLSYM